MSNSITVGLHGFLGRPESLAPLRIRGPLLLGHGTDGADSFVDEAERIANGLAPETHLVGYSMGARLALQVALLQPERLSALTLISGHAGLRSQEARAERLAVEAGWVECLRQKGMSGFIELWEQLPLWRSQASVPDALLAEQKRLRSSHHPGGIERAIQRLGTGNMPDLWEQLPGLLLPTQLVAGALDPVYVQHAEEMARLLPDSRVHILADCGHNPILEAPHLLRPLLEVHT